MHQSMRPNILIINPDQMRADSMSHLANPASDTKHLDELATEGVSFRNAFCQNPVCTPSRCSFMSGWYPHVAGHRTMTHMLHKNEPVLLKYLKEAGYHVWMNGRNDLLPAQDPEYYKDYCTTMFIPSEKPDTAHNTDWRGAEDGDNYYSFFEGKIPQIRDIDQLWVEGACDFIHDYRENKPFCIFLPLMLPHPPYGVSEPYFSMIERNRLPARIDLKEDFTGKPRMLKGLRELQQMKNWDEGRYNELRAVYLGMCQRVDDFVGMLVKTLKNAGLYDNTAIFFFSDHGDYTGDYGVVEKAQNCFEDCLTNVPFIVKLPKEKQIRTGISEEMVELIDFYGTVEKLAELTPQHTHFGHSLIPYLQNRESSLRSEVFCEGGFCRGEEHCKETGGQGGTYKGSLYYPRQHLQCSDEMYNGKGIMIRTKRYKYVHRLYEQDEFYDLQQDRYEISNQINNLSYQSIIAGLKYELLNYYLSTCDVVPFEHDKRISNDMIGLLH